MSLSVDYKFQNRISKSVKYICLEVYGNYCSHKQWVVKTVLIFSSHSVSYVLFPFVAYVCIQRVICPQRFIVSLSGLQISKQNIIKQICRMYLFEIIQQNFNLCGEKNGQL